MALSLFDNSDTSQAQATELVAQALAGSDDGELFVEKRETQGFSFDDGKLKAASFDESQGFGLRAVTGETAAYAHSTEISAAALKRAAALCKSMAMSGGQIAASPERTNQKLYSAHNPVEAIGFAEKISLLQKVDGFARALGPEGMARPCGPAEGPFAELPLAGLVLHINREVIHHGAEIALLRDLYRHQLAGHREGS